MLVPQFPFWASYDLRYDNGDTLCWRTKTSDWHGDPCQTELCKDGRANAFNAAEGLAIQEQYGPNVYPDVTVRVFPLEACEETLQRYCDENINTQGDPPLPGEDLRKIGDTISRPWGRFVYMCVDHAQQCRQHPVLARQQHRADREGGGHLLSAGKVVSTRDRW